MSKNLGSLSEQEQIYILSQEEAASDDGYHFAKLTPFKVSFGDNSRAITGTFTGEKVNTTMPIRRGRGLLNPGMRIFDNVQIVERRKLEVEQQIKQNKQNE